MSEENKVKVLENEITRLCKLRDSTFSEMDEQQTGGAVELPGQVLNSSDFEEISESSSNEFDIGDFRNARPPSKTVIEVARAETETTNKYGNVKIINFLGLNFEVAVLQERNKNPILFLKVVSGLQFLACILSFITYCPGTNFQIIQTILGTALVTVSSVNAIQACKTSTKNLSKLDLKKIVLIISAVLLAQSNFVCAFVIKMPFNSLPLYLLSIYLTLIAVNIQIVVRQIPDFTPWDHPNYQLVYFFNKITMGFFNGTAIMDVFSDFVLAVQLVIRFRNYFLFLGILLLFFSSVDGFLVMRRSHIPGDKISYREYLLVTIIEILIISLSAIILFGVSFNRENQDDETLFVTVISLNTTVVNFLHQLFFKYKKFSSILKQDQVEQAFY